MSDKSNKIDLKAYTIAAKNWGGVSAMEKLNDSVDTNNHRN